MCCCTVRQRLPSFTIETHLCDDQRAERDARNATDRHGQGLCTQDRGILILCFESIRGKPCFLCSIFVHHQNALGSGNYNKVFHTDQGDGDFF
jgi:hypothetical protein